ncbi:MAG: helix-turn-helix domain-containing protein [Paracoccaceae bacterium]
MKDLNVADVVPEGTMCPKFSADCPSRVLFDEISDKWSMMILAVLNQGPRRFNVIKRQLEGVSQKSLTQTLRRLERNGLVLRHVLPTSPVAVEYEMSDLGKTLLPPFLSLYRWTKDLFPQVETARLAFDARR